MKNKVIKYILIFVFCICFLNIFTKPLLAKQDINYEFVLEKKVNIQDDKKGVYYNSNLYLTYDNKVVDIYSTTGNIKLNTTYKDSLLKNTTLYLISSDTLFIINLNLLSYKTVELDFSVNDIYVDEYIFLVGHTFNNPCIYLYDNEGELIKSNVYQVDEYASFSYVEKVGNLYLLVGEKDAFFNHPDFLKVGNKNDLKTFAFLVDKTLQKVKDYFFNENTSNEIIYSCSIDNNINIILDTSSKQYFYQFDKELNLIDYFSFNDDDKYHYIPNYLNKTLLLRKESSYFELGLYEDNNFNTIFKINKYLDSYNLTKGGIAFSYDDTLNVYSEHHLVRKNDLVLSKIKYEYTSTDHFKVESFFEELSFKLDSYSPYHMHMMSGNYTATYSSLNKLGGKILVKTNVIVKDFVNIIDGGIYSVGTTLQFFGDALLNGESINNGHSLALPGNYELTLTNVNGIKKTYNFEVVNNYYKDNDHYVIDVDYILDKKDELELDFELSSTLDIKHFIINNSKYENFEISDNHVILTLPKNDEYGYHNIYINSIVFKDNIIEINKDLNILTRKEKPQISISSKSSNDDIKIRINYKDLDNTLVDLYFKETNSNNTIKTYLKDTTSKLQSGSFVIRYELGDGITLEETLFNIEGSNVFTNIKFLDEEIIVTLHKSKSLEKVEVNSNNIYKSSNDNINLYIVIFTAISSVFIIFITLLIMIIKRKRRKVNRI